MNIDSQNKTLIFVSSVKYFHQLREIMKGFIGKSGIFLSPEIDTEDIPIELKGAILCRTFEEYEDLKHGAKVCAEDALQFIKKWGNLKIDDKKSLEDLTGYKNACFWRICDNFILQYYLADVVYYIRVISSIMEKERPAKLIILASKYNSLARIFFEIAKQKKIQVNWKATHKVIRLILPKFPIITEKSIYLAGLEFRICFPTQLYIFGLFFKNIIKSFMSRMYNLKFKKIISKNNKNILFYCSNKKQLDSIIPLVKELQKNIENKILLIDWYWKAGDANDILKKENIPHKIFDGYLTWKINESLWRCAYTFLNKWRIIERNSSFQRLLTIDDIFVWDLISDYLRKLFLFYFIKMSIFLDTAENIVDLEKPDIIIVTNEREYIARLCVLAGKFKGIPSLELQRGAFDDLPDREGPLYTDKMILDGEFGKRILEKRGISPEKLIVAGNPRYDVVIKKRHQFNKEKICRRLNIEMNKKIIVLTTTHASIYSKVNEKRRLLRTIFTAMRQFTDCHLVVKLHPAELSDKFHQHIRQQVNIKNISIVKDLDLWELISACDLFITSNSTTGSEAILMDKPFIFANISEIHPDVMSYVKSGAAIGVRREEKIEIAIRDILFNKAIQQDLKIAREKFISEHFFGLDGMATFRIANLITEMAKEKGQNKSDGQGYSG